MWQQRTPIISLSVESNISRQWLKGLSPDEAVMNDHSHTPMTRISRALNKLHRPVQANLPGTLRSMELLRITQQLRRNLRALWNSQTPFRNVFPSSRFNLEKLLKDPVAHLSHYPLNCLCFSAVETSFKSGRVVAEVISSGSYD